LSPASPWFPSCTARKERRSIAEEANDPHLAQALELQGHFSSLHWAKSTKLIILVNNFVYILLGRHFPADFLLDFLAFALDEDVEIDGRLRTTLPQDRFALQVKARISPLPLQNGPSSRPSPLQMFVQTTQKPLILHISQRLQTLLLLQCPLRSAVGPQTIRISTLFPRKSLVLGVIDAMNFVDQSANSVAHFLQAENVN